MKVLCHHFVHGKMKVGYKVILDIIPILIQKSLVNEKKKRFNLWLFLIFFLSFPMSVPPFLSFDCIRKIPLTRLFHRVKRTIIYFLQYFLNKLTIFLTSIKIL